MKDKIDTNDNSYLEDENGNELDIDIVTEFEREENGKRFVIYTDRYQETSDDELKDFYVAEIVTLADGTEELADVEDEDDMDYCQQVFDEFVEEVMSRNLGDSEEDEEEDTIVS